MKPEWLKKDKMKKIMFMLFIMFSCEDKICWIFKGSWDELKKNIRSVRFGDKFGQLNRIWGMSHIEGLLWSVQRGELFNESLN